ncbi:hypothetical protein COCMIDRAFT_38492 [Bipolaris oryzae ATCC 44560]|uniref:C2H2-type domain-containing protein n=1 Tax=Bipolaris oryzae ATCC 44560 TaxID=930090 RepID=W6Z1G8_COCMI|nr:uncharacterized protein COCMIDRAFT_38492 [Bipolaris oryzae ATCC 44560]EUC43553.1 hypothetical protein COCMIDRAFT_38492 [Bipolaris oryzae ATCC 44560]
MASDPASLTCEHCGDTFLRREHWDRHLRRHSGVKLFQCEVCSKSFARRDTLMRHSSIHHHGDQTHGMQRRCVQACLSCARLKQRCRGGLPCARCQRAGNKCLYSPGKATNVTSFSSRASETTAMHIDAVMSSSVLTDQHPNDVNSQSNMLHVTDRQPLEATEQVALYHDNSNPSSSSASNSQIRFSFSSTVATHPITVPATFTPSSLDDDTTFYTSNQWNPSSSLHGDTVMNEFAAGWDPMTAYIPFWLVPGGLGDVLDTPPYAIGNHNQQCGLGTHSHPPDYRMQSRGILTKLLCDAMPG